MKFNLTLILLFFSLFGFCQKSSWDINLQGLSTTKGIFSYPSIGLNLNNKFKIQSGVLIGKEYVNNSNVLGAQVDFIYFPNGKFQKQFNFLFIGSINYFNDKITLNTSEVKTNFIQSTLGYGFKYYLSRKVIINSNLGLGIILENRTFNFDTTDPKNKWGFAGIISMGITYML